MSNDSMGVHTDFVSTLEFATGVPVQVADIDVRQLVDHFLQLDPYGRKVALTLVAGLVRLKTGAT